MSFPDTDETRKLQGDIGALVAAFWGVPLAHVKIRLYDGPEMSVGVVYEDREWKWSLDPTVWANESIGILGVLTRALDYFTVEVTRAMEERRERLEALGVLP